MPPKKHAGKDQGGIPPAGAKRQHNTGPAATSTPPQRRSNTSSSFETAELNQSAQNQSNLRSVPGTSGMGDEERFSEQTADMFTNLKVSMFIENLENYRDYVRLVCMTVSMMYYFIDFTVSVTAISIHSFYFNIS